MRVERLERVVSRDNRSGSKSQGRPPRLALSVPALDETSIDRSIAGTCNEMYFALSRRLLIFLAQKNRWLTYVKSLWRRRRRRQRYYRTLAPFRAAYYASVFAIIRYFTSAFFRTTSSAERVYARFISDNPERYVLHNSYRFIKTFQTFSPEFSKLVTFGVVVIFDMRVLGSLDFTARKSCRANAPLLFDSTLNLRDKGKTSQNSAPETMRLRQPYDSSSAALTLSKLRFCESCLTNVCSPAGNPYAKKAIFLSALCRHRTITLCRRDDVAAPRRRVFARILMFVDKSPVERLASAASMLIQF